MVAAGTLSWLSSLALVLGALLVGDAINGAVVTGQYPITAPAAVIRVLPGAILIWLGARARTAPEYVPSESAENDSPSNAPESRAEGEEFDPDLSPLGGEEPRTDRGREEAGAEDDPTEGRRDAGEGNGADERNDAGEDGTEAG